ncbi:MAG: 50S ribosomal protein L21 [Halobacteriovorax sp.]|nr:50S ribosomal protein L21 [Halobacteriovorax sp.]MEE3079335.1 50S ribosomal protein L21 [Bdellovibrionota bacterium]
MYGVVEIAGHQYRVEAGMTLDVQKLSDEAGSTVEFDKVLLVGGEKTLVGKPVVDGAKVVAEVVKHDRARKVLVFKRKPGKYRRKNGHRQEFTTLKIKEIKA